MTPATLDRSHLRSRRRLEAALALGALVGAVGLAVAAVHFPVAAPDTSAPDRLGSQAADGR